MPVPHSQVIVAFAHDHLGLMEEPPGSNAGRDLAAFLAGTEWRPGQPWCYYFAWRCVREAYKITADVPAWIDRGGSCSVAAAVAQAHNKLSDCAATGSIALFIGGESGYYHAGIVSHVDDANGVIFTVEGNTNLWRSPEGVGVYAHQRHIRDAHYIIW